MTFGLLPGEICPMKNNKPKWFLNKHGSDPSIRENGQSLNRVWYRYPLFCWENKSSTYSQRNCTQKDYWTKCALFNEQTDTDLNNGNIEEHVPIMSC